MAQKAEIHVLDKNGKEPKKKIKVMFNPTEYSLSESSELSVTKTGQIQFQKLNKADFTVSLFFDTYEFQEDVRDKTREITELLKPSTEGKEKNRPQICLFTWGNFGYKGVIYKIDQKFTMFLDTGIPVRANLTVSFKPIESKKEQEKSTGKSESRKFWTVKTGDRLDLIAYWMLKDVNLWRKIAETNIITKPLAFPSEDDIGRILIIPDLHKS